MRPPGRPPRHALGLPPRPRSGAARRGRLGGFAALGALNALQEGGELLATVQGGEDSHDDAGGGGVKLGGLARGER